MFETPPATALPDETKKTAQAMAVEVASSSSVSGTDEEAQPQSTAAGPVRVPPWQFACLSISLGIGLFLSFMDSSITSTAIYSIGAEFGTMTKVTWVALAYTLADVGLAIVFTSLANIIGRFNAYLVAQCIFFVFSLASGFAQTLEQLIALRTLQGVGGSGLYTIALIIWQETSSGVYRQVIGGCIGLCIASGGVMGPVLGGIITGSASWRWIFWINPPIMVISTVLFVTTYPHGGGRLQKRNLDSVRKIDYVGTLLLIGGSIMPCFALMHAADELDSWHTGTFIGPMAAGCICWIMLVLWGMYNPSLMPGRFESAFPPHLFRNRRFSAGAANSILMGFGFVITIFNVPLRMQTVHNKGPLIAGLTLLPLLCCSAIGSFLGSALSPKKDRIGPTLMCGSALMSIGTGLLATLGSSIAPGSTVYGVQVFVGLGFGMTASAATLLANMEVKKREHAISQGIVAAARVLGGAVGLSAATVILGNRVKARLTFMSAAQAANPAANMDSFTSPQQAMVRKVYSDAFNLIFIVAASVSVAAFLAACLTYNTSTEDLQDRLTHKSENDAEERERQMALSDMSAYVVSEKGASSYVGTEKATGSSHGSDNARSL